MCHLLLLMPLVALPMFWFLPLAVAAPIYGVILALSAWLYLLMMRAMHKPLLLGRASLLHKRGVVLDREDDGLRVRVRSEVWQAHSNDPLGPGDIVEVVGSDGLVLEVAGLNTQTETTR